MPRSLLATAVAFAIACLFLTQQVHAQDENRTKVWVGASGFFSQYAMGDVNDDIQAVDEQIDPSFDEIDSGPGFSVDLGADVGRGWRVGASLARMEAISEASDASGKLTYDFAATVLTVNVAYTLPSSSSIATWGAISTGIIRSAGEVAFDETAGPSMSEPFEGSGSYISAQVGIDLPVASLLVLAPEVGYRVATIPRVEIDGRPLLDIQGGDYDADYTGPFARLGLRFYFPQND